MADVKRTAELVEWAYRRTNVVTLHRYDGPRHVSESGLSAIVGYEVLERLKNIIEGLSADLAAERERADEAVDALGAIVAAHDEESGW